MKRILTFAFLLVAVTCFSQENVLKLGFSNLFYGDYSLGYERMISDNNSLNLNIGYIQPTSSFLIAPGDFKTKEFTVKSVDGGFHSSLEYRFYLGKSSAPRGFYVAPYVRYGQIKGVYSDSVRETLFDVNATGNMFGAGVQLGAQWLIKDLVSIDFSFFGAGVERYCAKLKYKTADHSSYDYSKITADVVDYIDDVDYLSKRLTNKVSTSNLTSKLPFLFPGFRFSVSVGIAF
ncbi:MAG TPA: DUF3575 domain-containing protein [Prolixibacteraceae bacterium]|nr:DUF3575 domain-containing protein [Prolixibacteraceae bacterium]HPS12589.1 DUF3575 domain-containing protein [Prolixibacteraceae bacterium]